MDANSIDTLVYKLSNSVFINLNKINKIVSKKLFIEGKSILTYKLSDNVIKHR